MKKFKNVIYFLSIFILILEISPTLAMEDEEKEAPQNPPQSEVFSPPPSEQSLMREIQALKTTIGVLQQTQEAHKKEIGELYEHIGAVIYNKPPVYKELIPTSNCFG